MAKTLSNHLKGWYKDLFKKHKILHRLFLKKIKNCNDQKSNEPYLDGPFAYLSQIKTTIQL